MIRSRRHIYICFPWLNGHWIKTLNIKKVFREIIRRCTGFCFTCGSIWFNPEDWRVYNSLLSESILFYFSRWRQWFNGHIQGLHIQRNWKRCFHLRSCQRFREIICFKLQFTTAFPLNAISDLYVSINCFPVVNRHLNKFTYRLQNTLNIVPLATEELFQDLISISTSEGKSFMSNPMGTGFLQWSWFYTLRYGGVERFDDRQSVELLNNVIELLRDESAAFSSAAMILSVLIYAKSINPSQW